MRLRSLEVGLRGSICSTRRDFVNVPKSASQAFKGTDIVLPV
jgi:hypothetical protein